MKNLSLALVLLVTACGSAPTAPYYGSETKQPAVNEKLASKDASTSTQQRIEANLTEAKMQEIFAAAKTQSEQARANTQVAQVAAIAPQDFMGQVETQLQAKLLGLEGKNGKKLSPEQSAAIAAAFMPVVAAAQQGKAKATGKAFAAFFGAMEKSQVANKVSAAGAAGGLIADVLALALDIVKLALNLVKAVVNLDVAGVVAVAADAVNVVIDFLV